jgi:hypothetical protein
MNAGFGFLLARALGAFFAAARFGAFAFAARTFPLALVLDFVFDFLAFPFVRDFFERDLAIATAISS